MGLTFARSLRLSISPSIAFVGAGGKTTAMFQLASELIPPILITSTTHIGKWQIPLADHHLIATFPDEISNINFEGITLITGSIKDDDRTESIDPQLLDWLHARATQKQLPLLIEADGARQRSLKAPKSFEPPIPDFVDNVIVVSGLSAIDKPLSEETVYLSESFSKLSGLQLNRVITPEAIVSALCHPQGGLKNIPKDARRIALLNQADSPESQSVAHGMVKSLLIDYDSVIISSMKERTVFANLEPVAGIILAAGGSTRFGQPKQLLDWHGQSFVRSVTRTALEAGLSEIIVVTGANAGLVEDAVKDLNITIKRNDDWQTGQASSIRTGIDSISKVGRRPVGAAIFLLADQPQIEPSVIRALVEHHASEMKPIIAPMVMMDQRANPVLFDRVTFPDLIELQGDIGGRGIFSKHHVEYMPWHDDRLLHDVDFPEDYLRLIEDDTL
jgi:molybdenum cofactor cytidylyltransferase